MKRLFQILAGAEDLLAIHVFGIVEVLDNPFMTRNANQGPALCINRP
jgi:hypothetical protein